MDFIDDGMLGGTDMNNNFTGMLPVFNDDDDMTFPLDPGMDTFGMGGESFGGSYNMHSLPRYILLTPNKSRALSL